VVLALLAVVAVSVALARPVCELYESPVNAHDHVDCCAPLAHGVRAEPPAAAASAVEPPFVPVPMARSLQWHASGWSKPAIPADRPPISLSYHARSARMLV
jgi:hypothetical protein